MSVTPVTPDVTAPMSLAARRVTAGAALLVTVGAVAATAHGLYVVAVASGVSPAIAALYPLITDGLALTAYAATRHLSDAGRRYAWTVVVTAAALSGLAQAVERAVDVTAPPVALRFGVGAWPAVAAVTAAHLVYLLAQRRTPNETAGKLTVPVDAPSFVDTPAAVAARTVSPPRPPRPRKPSTAVEVRQLAVSGLTAPEIALRLGCSKRTVYRHLPKIVDSAAVI